VRARGPVGGEPQDPRAEGGQRPSVGRDLELIEFVQVADQLRVGPLIPLRGLGMPDAQAEQEPARVPSRDPVIGGGHGGGVVLPHVDDPGGHRDVVRRGQQVLDAAQVAVGGAADPDRAVAKRLRLGHQVRGEP
jgi:hypothetical protein